MGLKMNNGAEKCYQVEVDRSRCCAYGICAEICPEIYKRDAAGFVYISSPDIPPALLDRAREGAEACPQLAITVTDV
jgi:ferredoxin